MRLSSLRFPFHLRTRQNRLDERVGISSSIAFYATYRVVGMEQFARTSVSGKSGIPWMAMVCTRMFQSRLNCMGNIRHCPARLQLRILQRAMRMLRRGGKIVYSTCSLNPVENEAVVAEALRTVPGMHSTVPMPSIPYVYLGFELVEVSESLPSLIWRPGLTKWLPTVGRDLKYFETYEHYVASLPGGKGTARLARSHWPPSEDLGLERWYVHLAWHRKFWLLI